MWVWGVELLLKSYFRIPVVAVMEITNSVCFKYLPCCKFAGYGKKCEEKQYLLFIIGFSGI